MPKQLRMLYSDYVIWLKNNSRGKCHRIYRTALSTWSIRRGQYGHSLKEPASFSGTWMLDGQLLFYPQDGVMIKLNWIMVHGKTA
jgi:hypothetical protein